MAAVGRLVDCSQADDRRMIRLVRARPLLYARNNMPVASFYSQVKSLWKEVADEMGWTVADVRRKWSHIRNSYSRHIRNELHGARTGRGRMVSRWYLADELAFLRDHMATDTRSSMFSYGPTMLKMDLEPVKTEPFLHTPWFSLAAGGAPEPPAAPDASSSEGFPLDESSGSQPAEPDENSAYFQFFRGIFKDYEQLPPKKQRLFRRQCLSLLHGMLDEETEPVDLSDPPDEADNILPH